MKIKAKYPCGFEYEMNSFSLIQTFFGYITLTTKDEAGDKWDCPLHGKNCHKYKQGGD